ncbi:MAG TPA: hypothetical protein VMI12_13325 [Puia sp.]|nr:hypothetical protein [Puia sp.]
MKDQHLSDADIQQFVLDKTECASNLVSHMQYCPYCREKAETYLIIISGIKQESKASFDFDLTSLVLEKIPATKKKFSGNGWFLYLTICLASVPAIFIYLYRDSFSNLFKIYIPEIGSGLSTIAIWLFASAILVIVIFQVVEIFKKYKRKADSLNYY